MAKEKGEGAWIFVSHSHKDIEKVRFIRNEFEKRGGNPLLFFLKCLDDESELDDLIKREISERNWFILCDSPNARASKWVQEEVKMINSLEGKVFEKINLEDDIEKQLDDIINFSRRSTVFISHAHNDQIIAQRFIDKFKKHDFGVFDYKKDLQAGDIWEKVITNTIDDAVTHGFVILLISKNTFASSWLQKEVTYALSKGARVIPVILEESILNSKWFKDFSKSENSYNNIFDLVNKLHIYQLDTNNIDESIEKLVLKLKFRYDKGE